MRTKFKIHANEKNNQLQLDLTGNFDDISICDLVDVLKQRSRSCNRVVVNTSSLEKVAISMIGRDVFRRNIHQLQRKKRQIVFTGESAGEIFPDMNQYAHV